MFEMIGYHDGEFEIIFSEGILIALLFGAWVFADIQPLIADLFFRQPYMHQPRIIGDIAVAKIMEVGQFLPIMTISCATSLVLTYCWFAYYTVSKDDFLKRRVATFEEGFKSDTGSELETDLS